MSSDDPGSVPPQGGAGPADTGAAEDLVDSDISDLTQELSNDLAAELGDPVALAHQRDEYLDSLRRLQADFDNYRKRVQRDQEMAADRAGEKLVNAMLPVLDTFELALSHEAEPDASPLAKMHDQLLSALEAQGLERLSPHGEPFDPEEADAVMHEAGEGTSGSGPVVSQVLRAGYRWKGRVMRAAMVKVRD